VAGPGPNPLAPAVRFAPTARWYRPSAGVPGTPAAALAAAPAAPLGMPAVSASVELPPLVGLRVEEALTRVGGNRGLYAQLLRRFVATEADAPARLAACLQAGDRGGAGNLLHAIRGVAGNLGAAAVQDAAAEFEAGLAATATAAHLEDLQGRFAAALEQLVVLVRAALGNEPAPATVPAGTGTGTDPARIRAVVAQMRQLLANLDTAAGDCLGANRDLLCALLGAAEFATFEQQVQDFAFQEALERLVTAARTHGALDNE
jgi:two-component system, sensor histidine kinase and response regulator